MNSLVAVKHNETEKPKGMRRFLTVEAEHSPERVLMEFKGNMPIGMLFPILTQTLGWRSPSDEMDAHFRLIAVKEGREIELKNTDTLISADIPNGSVLRIIFIDKKQLGKDLAKDTLLSLQPTGMDNGISMGASAQDHRSNIPEPHLDVQVKEPCLIGPSGKMFPIRNPPVWIGRPDKGFKPEIDLTGEEDIDNPTVGRRHAQIDFEDDKYVLKPKPSVNGTFVNGQDIYQYQSSTLRDGDRVRLGDVELIFRMP